MNDNVLRSRPTVSQHTVNVFIPGSNPGSSALPFNPVATGFVNAQGTIVIHENLLQHFQHNRLLPAVRQVIQGKDKSVNDVIPLQPQKRRTNFKGFCNQELHPAGGKETTILDQRDMAPGLILNSSLKLSLVIASKFSVIADILTDYIFEKKPFNFFSHSQPDIFIHIIGLRLNNFKLVKKIKQCLVNGCCILSNNYGNVTSKQFLGGWSSVKATNKHNIAYNKTGADNKYYVK